MRVWRASRRTRTRIRIRIRIRIDGAPRRGRGRADRRALGRRPPLALRPEPGAHNALASLLDAHPGQAVGHVPDWMLDIVRRITDADPDHRVSVEPADGPETPAHLRLLCRLEARVTRPAGRRTIRTSTTSRRTAPSRP